MTFFGLLDKKILHVQTIISSGLIRLLPLETLRQ